MLSIWKVIPLIVSSEFLKMDTLYNECLRYVVTNIEAVAKVQISMKCLTPATIKRLAQQVDVERLDFIRDRRDKFISKIFFKMLEMALEEPANLLHRCVLCNRLFTEPSQKELLCLRNKRIYVDAHGRLEAIHVRDTEFECKKFINFVKEKFRISWREMYWKVWAYQHLFHCSVCDSPFLLSELVHCSYHPCAASYGYSSNTGRFPCCQTEATRFASRQQSRGCRSTFHRAAVENDAQQLVLNKAMLRKHLISAPFEKREEAKGPFNSPRLEKLLA